MTDKTNQKQWIYQNSPTSANSNYDILESGGFHILASLGSPSTYWKRDKANAQLIASAPELLEACKQALEDHNNDCGTILGNYDQIQLAIHKAEGV